MRSSIEVGHQRGGRPTPSFFKLFFTKKDSKRKKGSRPTEQRTCIHLGQKRWEEFVVPGSLFLGKSRRVRMLITSDRRRAFLVEIAAVCAPQIPAPNLTVQSASSIRKERTPSPCQLPSEPPPLPAPPLPDPLPGPRSCCPRRLASEAFFFAPSNLEPSPPCTLPILSPPCCLLLSFFFKGVPGSLPSRWSASPHRGHFSTVITRVRPKRRKPTRLSPCLERQPSHGLAPTLWPVNPLNGRATFRPRRTSCPKRRRQSR